MLCCLLCCAALCYVLLSSAVQQQACCEQLTTTHHILTWHSVLLARGPAKCLQCVALSCCLAVAQQNAAVCLPHCTPGASIIPLLMLRDLAGNSGLCNPPSGRQLAYACPVCDNSTLQAQQQADPAAVAGAVSQPALTPTAPPGPITSWSNSNQSDGAIRLIWPFLTLAGVGVLVCCVMAVTRKRGQVCFACLYQCSALHVHLDEIHELYLHMKWSHRHKQELLVHSKDFLHKRPSGMVFSCQVWGHISTEV